MMNVILTYIVSCAYVAPFWVLDEMLTSDIFRFENNYSFSFGQVISI